MDAYRLGIDLGTSNTAAMVRGTDGRTRPLLFDGAPLLPSAVCLDPDGHLLVGRDAAHAARAYPDRFEPNPKQRADEGTVLLGDSEVAVDALFAAILRRVATEAARTMGAPPGDVCLTHPAAWGPGRRSVLLSGAAQAGLGRPRLISEPVAAATYFVEVVQARLPVGSCLVVYDFGAGTFDASVVRRTGDGFAVLAAEGLQDAGGLDIDAALLGYLGAVYGARHPRSWQKLEEPDDLGARRARRLLWDDVRTAKEMLSRATSTLVHLPLVEEDAPLGREQLERLARPIVDRTVAATRAAVRSAELPPADLAAVFLVGGSSRLPLAATLLHRGLGIAPTAIEQPELVVAEGSVCGNGANGARTAVGRARPPAAEPPAAEPPPVDAPPIPAAAAAPMPPPGAAGPTPPPGPLRRYRAVAPAAVAGLLFVGWLVADPAVLPYVRNGWSTIWASTAIVFLPAHATWLARRILAGQAPPARLIAHVCAVAGAFVTVAAITRPVLGGGGEPKYLAVAAAMLGGIWLAVRAALRPPEPNPARPALLRWLRLSLGLGAAAALAVMAGGETEAWYRTQNMSTDAGAAAGNAVYYLPYAVGVAVLVGLSAALGALGARFVRERRPGDEARRAVGVAAGVLLAVGGMVLDMWQSGAFGS